MQNNTIKTATGLISHYDLLLRHKISYVISYLRGPIFEQTYIGNEIVEVIENLKKELSEVLTLADEIAKLVDRNFISGLTRNILLSIKQFNSEVRLDIGTMMTDLKSLVKIAREITAFLELIKSGREGLTKMTGKAVEYAEKLEHVEENFERILRKSVYAEEFLANADFYARRIWETRFHNKFYWLYHGTSVLFLKNIQKHGLDNSKISRGIYRALIAVSSYVTQAGLTHSGGGIKPGFDLRYTDETPFIYLTPDIDTVSAARAPNLPAFFYEVLDESALTETGKEKILSVLDDENKFILKAAWRFGRILRSRNRKITLHIKVDSDFLKYYGVADIFGDYGEFVRCEFDRYADMWGRKLSAFQSAFPAVFQTPFSQLVESAVRQPVSDKIHHWTWLEVVLRNVPPEFIYINVSGKLMPVGNFTEDMVPYVM